MQENYGFVCVYVRWRMEYTLYFHLLSELRQLCHRTFLSRHKRWTVSVMEVNRMFLAQMCVWVEYVGVGAGEWECEAKIGKTCMCICNCRCMCEQGWTQLEKKRRRLNIQFEGHTRVFLRSPSLAKARPQSTCDLISGYLGIHYVSMEQRIL